MQTPLDVVRAECLRPVPDGIKALAAAAIARHGGEANALGVLYYGSCLRDGVVEGRLADLYLIVRGYKAAHGDGWAARWNRRLPPNVYYVETEHAGVRLRAKYATLSLRQLSTRTRPSAFHPYFWARFSQPMGLAWVKDARTERHITYALAYAAVTAMRLTLPLYDRRPRTAERFWRRVFYETYRTELRVEPVDRAFRFYSAQPARYDALWAWGRYLVPHEGRRRAERRWLWRGVYGKLLSVLRLIKAGLTFIDGPDYLVDKIARHTGKRLTLTPWQRRHPLIAAWPILVRLLVTRTVR